MPSIDSPGAGPNVLWITLEDTSPRLGCYGDDLVNTPNIDRLATEGRRFTNTFATSPVCAPSRSATFTGCYQTAIGTHHHRTSETGRRVSEQETETGFTAYEAVPPHYVRLLPEYLRATGYFCTLQGSTDFQHATPDSAFHGWDGEEGTPDHWRERGDGQPFFAVFNPGWSHESGMFEGGDEPPPETDPGAVEVPPYLPNTPVIRRSIARQYDNVARDDERVGELLAELEAAGIREETLVVLWSDHGEGLPRCKRWPYDSGTHVPLIVSGPGVEAGTDDRLASLVDLAPTTLSLAGLDIPAHMDGRPLLGDRADGVEDRTYVFAARDRHDEMRDTVRSVRDDRYRYVRNYHPNRPYRLQNGYRNRHPAMQEINRLAAEDNLEGHRAFWTRHRRPPEELYDLRADPHEVDNLAGNPAHREALDRLGGALDDWLDRTDDRGLDDEPAMVEGMWPGGEQRETAPPDFIPNGRDSRGTDVVAGGDPDDPPVVELESPAELSLICATEGASMLYARDGEASWTLYTGPIELDPGRTTMTARANRYGYADSDRVAATFEVTTNG